jgi:chaperone required for assembly of F1-ATPase
VKRFYTEVATGKDNDAAATAPTDGEGGCFTVLLDGRPVRTPARRVLALPTEALAQAVAGEWRRQRDEVVPAAMPLTRLATTCVDLMPARRSDAIEETAGYAGTDLLCYRAAAPDSLVARQQAAWQPWLDWAARQLDAPLLVADAVMPVAQPASSLRALRAAVERLDDWRLVGLHAATTAMGSLVLALALEGGLLDAEAAFATALLDELFAIERWGEDEGLTLRHARLRADLAAAGAFLEALPRARRSTLRAGGRG